MQREIDTATLERQFSAERSEPIRVERSTSYDFPALPFRIQVVRLQGGATVRVIAFAIDPANHPKAFYDSGYVSPECGVPDLDVSAVALEHLADHPLLVLDERRSEVGCAGVSTTEVVTALFFDSSNAFRKVLALEKRAADFHDDRDNGQPTYRYAYLFPNSCTNPRSCLYLSVFTLGWDKQGQPPFSAYKWNEDFSALVGFR